MGHRLARPRIELEGTLEPREDLEQLGLHLKFERKVEIVGRDRTHTHQDLTLSQMRVLALALERAVAFLLGDQPLRHHHAAEAFGQKVRFHEHRNALLKVDDLFDGPAAEHQSSGRLSLKKNTEEPSEGDLAELSFRRQLRRVGSDDFGRRRSPHLGAPQIGEALVNDPHQRVHVDRLVEVGGDAVRVDELLAVGRRREHATDHDDRNVLALRSRPDLGDDLQPPKPWQQHVDDGEVRAALVEGPKAEFAVRLDLDCEPLVLEDVAKHLGDRGIVLDDQSALATHGGRCNIKLRPQVSHRPYASWIRLRSASSSRSRLACAAVPS